MLHGKGLCHQTFSMSRQDHRRGCKSMDLRYAIKMKKLEAAKEILKDKTIDLNSEFQRITLLTQAISSGDPEMVKLLLDNGADVNLFSFTNEERYEPPFFTACRAGKIEIINVLLDYKASLNATDFYNNTPLWVAVKHQHVVLVKHLFEMGAAINVTWTFNEHPLYLTAKYSKYCGRKFMAKLLLRNCIPVNVIDRDGLTLLSMTLVNGNKDFSRILLECGTNIYPMSWSSLDAKLPVETKNDEEFYGWLKSQLTSPAPLQRQCRSSIRYHLAKVHRSSILKYLLKLPLPQLLVKYVSLEELLL